ncbi:MAG: hypothetical protein CFH41_02639 [Alphaproteobacteria bacterium MarineAlpha11_Bin1]|nr:MAG: hypothetical protein CFH41_02639 [Alphaproteobacteria bacterium MarineAlpha11_Bin1]|tara:strand:- start:6887 stop:7471 length:585 start_codon:yes stop_codon:yes gene_type:complete
MISSREVFLSIYGAYQFAKFKRNAVDYFENTPKAFWRSFYSALIALPAYILLVSQNFVERPVNVSGARIVIVESTAYVIGWVIFPLIMISFTDTLNRFDRYYRFVAAWNWSIILQVLLFLSVTTLITTGIVPAQLAGFVSLIAIITILFYQGYIATMTLEIRASAALIVVSIDFVLALCLKILIQSFYTDYSGA